MWERFWSGDWACRGQGDAADAAGDVTKTLADVAGLMRDTVSSPRRRSRRATRFCRLES